MTDTDPENPDPTNDPQDDPGLPLEGGIPSSGGADPEPDVDTGGPFTQVAPPT